MKAKHLYTALLLAGTGIFAACSSDDETLPGDNGGNGGNETEVPAGTTLSGTLTSNTRLKAGNAYNLSGQLTVESGATLYIEEGVRITAKGDDDVVDYILVKQGGKIEAEGTAARPIIMTSTEQTPGAWGGIHICGRAKTNVGTGKSEIGDATYGGDNDADNSGTLKYVRVEFSGYAFSSEKEANGFTFYGVGNGTTVECCEAYKGSDDGFEFFGGSVNVSNLVAVSCSDDSFDWTEGWRGTGENLVAYQEAKASLGYDCDCLIEADNNENNFSALPVSKPTLKNLILIGNNSEEAGRGVRLRRGTQVNIDGAKICGKKNGVTLESEETENALLNGTSTLLNITTDSTLRSEKGLFTNDRFVAAGNTVTPGFALTFEQAKASCAWMSGGWVK